MKDPLLRLTERPIDPPTELNLVVKNVSYVNLRAVKTDRSILTGNTKVRGWGVNATTGLKDPQVATEKSRNKCHTFKNKL